MGGEKSVIASYEGSGDLTNVTQTITELFADVPVNGVVQSENTLDAGDYWTRSYSMILADGREMKIGSTTTVDCINGYDDKGTYTLTLK